jgi:hypothetical protein
MPAFSFRHIKDLYSDFWKHSILFTEALRSHLDGVSVDANGEKLIDIQSWAS